MNRFWIIDLRFWIAKRRKQDSVRWFMKLDKLLMLIAVSFLCAPVATAQEKAAEKLGKVDFPVSCIPAAQVQFNRAVAMLHSFWFPQAPKAFAAVSEIDPQCAMA